ncbi:hypothetical protein [Mangrovibacterium lignilyticum]|uniref:hypothetical protein n=1 Tax=Mangrovibacterium lignilyticum TaxID=2668052 RepID=UPI0013D6767B|nr:hypothetical protein [Mangrovibacterium lignilyticum]
MSSMKGFTRLLIFSTVLVIISSCLNRQFIDGRAEIGSSLDTTLHDSSFVFGHIYHVDWSVNEYYLENQFEVWVENSDLKTTNDTSGYYSLKMTPGTYTIKCQSTYNEWERLIEEVKSLELLKNTKTEINFYIGNTVE